MKTLLLALSFLTTVPAAFAGSQTTTFYCKGMGADEGKTMYARLLNGSEIREGDAMEFLFVVRDGSETLFSGHVDARNEDVMLSFKSKRHDDHRLSAMIYLDEYDQTWVKIGRGESMRFSCGE